MHEGDVEVPQSEAHALEVSHLDVSHLKNEEWNIGDVDDAVH